jgi:hypothetical protein
MVFPRGIPSALLGQTGTHASQEVQSSLISRAMIFPDCSERRIWCFRAVFHPNERALPLQTQGKRAPCQSEEREA